MAVEQEHYQEQEQEQEQHSLSLSRFHLFFPDQPVRAIDLGSHAIRTNW